MKCKLRFMEENDLEMVLTWRNAPTVRHNMYTSHEISYSEHQQWWSRESNNIASILLIAEISSRPVGVVIFTNIKPQYQSATWAFYSADTAMHGVGTHMEISALHYAFTVLKLNRLECEVLDFNYQVVMLHRKFGFELEGIKREAFLRDGKAHDIYCLSILKKDWNSSLTHTIPKLPRIIKNQFVINNKVMREHFILDNENNPVHLEHNMLINNLFSFIFTKKPFGNGTVYLEQSLNFLSSLDIYGKIEVELLLISQIGRKATFKTIIKNNALVLLEGEAKIFLPETCYENE